MPPHLADIISITEGRYHVIFDGIEEDAAKSYTDEMQKRKDNGEKQKPRSGDH